MVKLLAPQGFDKGASCAAATVSVSSLKETRRFSPASCRGSGFDQTPRPEIEQVCELRFVVKASELESVLGGHGFSVPVGYKECGLQPPEASFTGTL